MKSIKILISRRILLSLCCIALTFFIFSCNKEALKSPNAKLSSKSLQDSTRLKDTLYIGGSNNTFYALNASDGNIIWSQVADNEFAYSNPALNNKLVYAGNINGKMYAYNAVTGNIVWSYTTGSEIESSPVVANGLVYFGSIDHNFYALDAATGALKWSFGTTGAIGSNPAIANGVVYFGADNGCFYALDATTGAEKWHYVTNALFSVTTAVISNGSVYVGNRAGDLFSLNASNGQLNWKFSTENHLSLEQTRPVISNGVIYLSSNYNYINPDFTQKGSVYAINQSDGSLKWESLKNTEFPTGPEVANGNVFIEGDNLNFYKLNATDGSVIWEKPIITNTSMPTIKNGVIYVADGASGFMCAMDELSGDIKWKSSLGAISFTKPVISGN